MIDTSGHHIVYGELQDYLTAEILKDTDDDSPERQIVEARLQALRTRERETRSAPGGARGNKPEHSLYPHLPADNRH